MNVLYLATRAPYGRMHGHKMGIRTYINALKGAGHNVTLVAFQIPGDTALPEDLGVETHYLTLPSKSSILWRLLTKAVPGALSLNECLYLDEKANTRIQEIVADKSIDLIVADMIRTASYAHRSGRPWILDHEDLLSERYELWASRSTGDENILGYLEGAIPAFARPLAKAVFRMVLGRESRILDRRELYWTDRAGASSLRSLEETERLAARTKRRVFCMPVTVPVPDQPVSATLTNRPMTAVFTGGLTYQPNLDGLRAYVERIIPEFERQGVELPVLNVIGAAPDNLRLPLEHPSIKFLGYVPDINEELARTQVFFAPIVSGTGIKTKVLEALACGLPLIALPAGLTGLQGEHGTHFLRAEDPADFVRQYVRVRDDSELARSLGEHGRKLAIASYSIDAATKIVSREIDAIKNVPFGPDGRKLSAKPTSMAA
ncbi:MAG TPA: glycosyltransferase [Mesorhizobium sp.]